MCPHCGNRSMGTDLNAGFRREARGCGKCGFAYLFELLAVLHLNALSPAGQHGAMTPRVEHVLLALQGLADERLDELQALREAGV